MNSWSLEWFVDTLRLACNKIKAGWTQQQAGRVSVFVDVEEEASDKDDDDNSDGHSNTSDPENINNIAQI